MSTELTALNEANAALQKQVDALKEQLKEQNEKFGMGLIVDIPCVADGHNTSIIIKESPNAQQNNNKKGKKDKKDNKQTDNNNNKDNNNKDNNNNSKEQANANGNANEQKPKKEKKPKEAKPPKPAPVVKEVDVSRLDLRVGKIVSCEPHPEADSLYLEMIDVGEEQPRQVISVCYYTICYVTCLMTCLNDTFIVNCLCLCVTLCFMYMFFDNTLLSLPMLGFFTNKFLFIVNG